MLSDSAIKIDSFKNYYSIKEISLVDSNSSKELIVEPDLVICENHYELSNMRLNQIYHESIKKPQPLISDQHICQVDSLNSLRYK